MSRARFPTARSLFETFPELAKGATIVPGDEAPVAYLKGLLAQEKFDEAVKVCAHLLPRREAVWWACGCARLLLGEIPRDRAACLIAAENWAQRPSEDLQKVAMKLGSESDSNDALSWLAMAAGWSGGLLFANRDGPVPMPHYLTPRAAAIAVTLSAVGKRKPERANGLKQCIVEGIKLAEQNL
jgi:hypothetical protein